MNGDDFADVAMDDFVEKDMHGDDFADVAMDDFVEKDMHGDDFADMAMDDLVQKDMDGDDFADMAIDDFMEKEMAGAVEAFGGLYGGDDDDDDDAVVRGEMADGFQHLESHGSAADDSPFAAERLTRHRVNPASPLQKESGVFNPQPNSNSNSNSRSFGKWELEQAAAAVAAEARRRRKSSAVMLPHWRAGSRRASAYAGPTQGGGVRRRTVVVEGDRAAAPRAMLDAEHELLAAHHGTPLEPDGGGGGIYGSKRNSVVTSRQNSGVMARGSFQAVAAFASGANTPQGSDASHRSRKTSADVLTPAGARSPKGTAGLAAPAALRRVDTFAFVEGPHSSAGPTLSDDDDLRRRRRSVALPPIDEDVLAGVQFAPSAVRHRASVAVRPAAGAPGFTFAQAQDPRAAVHGATARREDFLRRGESSDSTESVVSVLSIDADEPVLVVRAVEPRRKSVDPNLLLGDPVLAPPVISAETGGGARRRAGRGPSRVSVFVPDEPSQSVDPAPRVAGGSAGATLQRPSTADRRESMAQLDSVGGVPDDVRRQQRGRFATLATKVKNTMALTKAIDRGDESPSMLVRESSVVQTRRAPKKRVSMAPPSGESPEEHTMSAMAPEQYMLSSISI
jgi:hypothetical protein